MAAAYGLPVGGHRARMSMAARWRVIAQQKGWACYCISLGGCYEAEMGVDEALVNAARRESGRPVMPC